MNVEQLGRRAVEIIKQNWGLPKSGLLAGGSIANIVWELVSGNKAVVNDIDVFQFDGVTEYIDNRKDSSLFNYKEIEDKYYEDYTGMCFRNVTKDFYTITESTKDDIFNNIRYKSNSSNPEIILRSFDINSTKIGYSIEQDKIFWTKEFEDFLQTGELKVCNLMTPSHTALRIAKKMNELGAKLDEFEYKLIQHALDYRFNDVIKMRFKERYYEMYQLLESQVSKYFTVDRDLESEDYVKEHHKEIVTLYRLHPVIENDNSFERAINRGVFTHNNIQQIYNSITFLFYMRNIYGNTTLEELWSKLSFFFNDVDYIDQEVIQEDIELLARFAKNAPNSIENLKGLKLSEQISLIKKFFEKFKDDPIVAISILEKQKVDKDIELDENTSLLLELSVRKEIINDTRGKVYKIFGIKSESDEPTNDISWLF
jgi:hypothetical protein